MITLLAHIWKHLGKYTQWRILWIFHSKFNVGTSIIIPNTEGKILLGNHVFSAQKYPWRLIGGYISKGENIFTGAKREVREELGIDIEIDRVLLIRTGFAYRVEFTVVAKPLPSDIVFKIDSKELVKVEWFDLGLEPENTLDYHKEIIKIFKNNTESEVEIVNL